MRILLNWTYSSDVVECPQEIAENLQYYQLEFDKWLQNRENQHGYWTTDGFGNEWGLEFGSDAFVMWLNENILINEEKAVIVQTAIVPSLEEKKLPHINF